MPAAMHALAAQSPAGIAFNQILPWLAALLVLAILGGVLVLYLRHRLLGEEDESGRGIMDELRAMRDRGDIDEEEYEQARLVMVARASGRDLDELRAEAIRKAGGLVAEPGHDLLGRPLPKPEKGVSKPPQQGTDLPNPDRK